MYSKIVRLTNPGEEPVSLAEAKAQQGPGRAEHFRIPPFPPGAWPQLPFRREPERTARDAGIRTLALHFCDEGLPFSQEKGAISLGGQMFGLRVAILLPAFTLPSCQSRTSGLACFRMGICHPIPQRNCGRFSRPSLIPSRERTQPILSLG